MRKDRRLWATPLFIVLLAIESSDIIFAADSIPAIFAITPDPFIVYTSNIFAMLGLRALYFAVSGFMKTFHALHFGFASIIIILGIKMLLSDVWHMPIALSLVLIVFILMLCVIVSLLRPRASDLKLLFERTERLGLIPFRRLLFIENIIDLGQLTVRDAMRRRNGVRVLRLDLPWEESLRMVRELRFSRYPLVESENAKPLGTVHVKDLLGVPEPVTPGQLRELARPPLEMREDFPLEDALARFQRRSQHLALVVDERGEWSGILTIEDVLEEMVGRIGDEHDLARAERLISLADALTPGRVLFDLQAQTMPEAIRAIVEKIPREELPAEPQQIIKAVQEREATMETYLGHGLAVPHARLDGLEKPVLAFARSAEGVAMQSTAERAELIFLLLTPTGAPRTQARLLADIVALLESEYIADRLRKAATPEELIEALRAGQQVAID